LDPGRGQGNNYTNGSNTNGDAGCDDIAGAKGSG
jgi:hypothetical protein